MKRALLFVTDAADRIALFDSLRRDEVDLVQVFEGGSAQKCRDSWEKLLAAASYGNADHVRLARISSIGGGVWTWMRELHRLASSGLRIHVLNDPELTLDSSQAHLLAFLVAARQREMRSKIRDSLAAARITGKLGRPPTRVDVAALVEERKTLSLRKLAKKFGIGIATAWRILQKHEELSREQGTSTSEGRE